MTADIAPGRGRAVLFRVVPTLLLLAALLAAEGLTRLVAPRLEGLDVLVAAPDQLLQLVGNQDTDARRRRPRLFEADPLLFWKLKPDVGPMVWNMTWVATNAQGFRHPGPILAKRSGQFRIICLGDSVTFGFRVPLARPDAPPDPEPAAPYPRLLEQALRARGLEVEVVTMAVPGYSSHQGRAWTRRDLRRLEPDLVIACFGWNDVSVVARPDEEVMLMSAPRVLAREVLLRSQLALHAAAALRPARGGRGAAAGTDSAPPRVSAEGYVANMRAIVAEARALPAKIAVLGPVYRDAITVPDEAARMTTYRSALAGAMRSAQVPYLEIPVLTEAAHPENAELFGEHIHPNEEGHRRMARELLTFLDAQALLPR
jgi:lysophospholipase L1-like esterase